MKKPVDLNSLISGYKKLPKDTFDQFLNIHGIVIRNDEIEQIESFINNLFISDSYFSYFYVGYKIPQIDKEFDLLRFGEDYILNVEIKSIMKDDDAREQLIKNQYYLSSLEKKLHLFTYIVEDKSLYKLQEDNSLTKVEFQTFEDLLADQKIKHITNIDDLFNPTEFLVSPFNNVDKFVNDLYFLTVQQREFKNEFLRNPGQFSIIEGLPGTGKTLMLYDLAKELNEDSEIALIHSGELNAGHLKLCQQYNWNIVPAKSYKRINTIKPQVIFIDETQRMYPHQLEYVIEYIRTNNLKGVFSIDPKQILSVDERSYNNIFTLNNLQDRKNYKLSKKIRTNKELGEFIKGLFNLNNMRYCGDIDNISIHYFDEIKQARSFSLGLEEEGWQIIDYTGQNYNGEAIQKMKLNMGLNAHGVLGQEFDKVLVLVGPTFFYNDAGQLTVRTANYYDPERMFYQSVTRTRKQLMLLVVNNVEFFTKLLGAISNSHKSKILEGSK